MGLLRRLPGVEELRRADLTYPEEGATRGGLPAGYHHVHRRARLGAGRVGFEGAAHALSGWDMHRRVGLAVIASSPVAVAGSVVVLTLGWGWLRIAAPCRVVYTVDEPNRRGFAYGTLPGHPECGEEAFIVELAANDEVWFDIRAFSRPALLVARAGGPFNRKVQSLITERYINALRT
ncbi:DUF1990 domain-containing protein [Micromonospora sp. S4605]|uniref:DUF1990 family protein n=1 Tax=Micromonospora sp. S4605 TaxID=1420897 RepID=UPI000D6FE138|nr:DUF1990 domain-containing protein [Micromonospora sp. S4605]PWU46609.1 DUF1990 domain-containing protein [Micromonospora sp. S4605]